jgi:GT2 family glycosyltransferase
MTLSVVLITRNRRELLLQNLRHCARHRDRLHEIVLVDNGSDDGTADAVAAEFPWVRLIRLPDNQGAMIPRNIGVLNATGAFVFFLDDDGCFDFTALPDMLAQFARDPAVGAVGGTVVNLPDADVFALDFAAYRPPQPRVFPSMRYRAGNVIMRRAAILKAGLLPARFFYGTCERDTACRLFREGYRVLIHEAGVLLHRKSVSRAANRRYYRLHYRNRLWMIWRNLPAGPAWRETLLTLAAGLLGSLRTWHLGAFLAGIADGLLHLTGVIRRERRPLTRAQYREFMSGCVAEARAGHRLQGLLKTVRLQREGE